ncbi:hypothetical protein B0G81_4643 [Paraburkholderia sp. BL6665CI2N2]|uniref:hypothetical protein n=1 Tax=Paraburkholderia sp. BL6665CI2N2 TaxID=1938806 RepID=UPI0010E0E54B|nr:hypothetical protein [Paraburkholderia sp. BL6665CI2N2]TDY24233.1 hypothetical protein B0G81_4643 [Paraburkholderia sp. BL6665CI2N2]
MSKIGKNAKLASRPPVDALQYEKLALSAFGSCERQLTQLNRLATLATSIYRNPALTSRERRSRQVLLELLVETCEEYEREVECDRELYQVIALDARGISHRRITAGAAAKASCGSGSGREKGGGGRRTKRGCDCSLRRSADTVQ